jgi:hypothetical protein
VGALLEVANVERGVVVRTSGEQFDSAGCALVSYASDVCAPVTRELLSGSEDESAECDVLDQNIFAVLVSLQGRTMRSSGNEEALVADAFDAELEKAAGRVLWGDIGDNSANVSLTAASVATVVAGASAPLSVASMLEEFWTRATGVGHQDTILHLGVRPLLELFGQVEGSLLKNLDIRVATSPGYPVNGMAVTGPVRYRISPVEVLLQHETTVNRIVTEGSALGSLEFDPCTAVRVA